MALYHFHAGVVTRAAGSSAVASAAYRAGEKLHSAYYGEDADYTHKTGVIYTEIFLPPNAPASTKTARRSGTPLKRRRSIRAPSLPMPTTLPCRMS